MNDIITNNDDILEQPELSSADENMENPDTGEQQEESIAPETEEEIQETIEVIVVEETEETSSVEEEEEKVTEVIESGETFKNKKEEEVEEIQPLHTKHPQPLIPIIDHRLLAGKLAVYDWLGDLPKIESTPEVVEVRFKNTRKAFFSNPSQLSLEAGDIVAVEAALGHDIGVISLSGELVKEQIRLKRVDLERNPLKKVYRKAKPHDIEKWQQAIALEHETMIRSRKIAADLKLNMKIGDVEYQGDKTKAIFYYIAEDRVDFRTLIKVLAETFRIRIEMKQIGTRQEAGRIGGIGPCGLKLCCSTFITNFISVSTSAARYQDISLNPQKLAGQCGKLKCCLNYEVDAYIDEQKDFPSTNIPLNTGDGLLYHQKTDIFGRMMSYSFDKDGKGIFIQLPVKRVKELIQLNRKGIIPPKALEIREDAPVDIKYTDGVGEESLNRFDEKRQKKHHPQNRNNNNNRNNGEGSRDNNGNNEAGKNVRNQTGDNNNGGNRNERARGNSEGRRNENNRGENRQSNNNRPNRPNNQRNGQRPEQRREQRGEAGNKPEQRNEQKPEQKTEE